MYNEHINVCRLFRINSSIYYTTFQRWFYDRERRDEVNEKPDASAGTDGADIDSWTEIKNTYSSEAPRQTYGDNYRDIDILLDSNASKGRDRDVCVESTSDREEKPMEVDRPTKSTRRAPA